MYLFDLKQRPFLVQSHSQSGRVRKDFGSDKPGLPFGIYRPCDWTQPVSALGAPLPASLKPGTTTSAPTAAVTAQRGGRDACQVTAAAGVQ